jgi:hypothetical protein
MHSPHPSHPTIHPGHPAKVREPAANELSVDFYEHGQSWRLIVSTVPETITESAATIARAEATVAAFEHALHIRKLNAKASNRFANDDEQATFGHWLKALSGALLRKSKQLSQYGDAMIADAPTAFRPRRAA